MQITNPKFFSTYPDQKFIIVTFRQLPDVVNLVKVVAAWNKTKATSGLPYSLGANSGHRGERGMQLISKTNSVMLLAEFGTASVKETLASIDELREQLDNIGEITSIELHNTTRE